MDPARSAAARDRAERAVFGALPELGAVPRRALALAVLAGVTRTGIASEIGIAGAELSTALATSRKALRRTRTELTSGGRCERAERALSDRLDGAPHALEDRFLDAHLGRCERCRAHERELGAALAQLRAEFDKPPAAILEPSPARARLRVVPPPLLLPAAPEPPPALEAPAAVEPPVALAPPAAAAPHQRVRAALPVAVAALVAVGLVAAAIALLSAFGSDPNVRAPWDAPDAPVVHPAPISGQ